MENTLIPHQAEIVKIEQLSVIENLYQFRFLDSQVAENFDYKPGQFVEISIPGVGEAPISICSTRTRKGFLELCVRKVGRVTSALHNLKTGARVGIRGPYGNGFPMEKMEESNLLLIAGGLGVVPLRGVLQYATANREKYGNIRVFYGIRSYATMLFRDEFCRLLKEKKDAPCEFFLSYEAADDKECLALEAEHSDRCAKGVTTKLFEKTNVFAENTYAVICGPPVMYRAVIKELVKRGFAPEQIYMTLERRMKCGVGKCGHCIMGNAPSIRYVCKDGPVFTYWDAIQTKDMI